MLPLFWVWREERGERRARTGLAGKDVPSYEPVITDMSWVRSQS